MSTFLVAPTVLVIESESTECRKTGCRRQLRRTRVDDLTKTRHLLKSTVQTLSKDLQQEAWNLVEQLDQKKFMFTPEGEFIPRDETVPIPGSRVKDIFKYFLLTILQQAGADQELTEPIGYGKFAEQLDYQRKRPIEDEETKMTKKPTLSTSSRAAAGRKTPSRVTAGRKTPSRAAAARKAPSRKRKRAVESKEEEHKSSEMDTDTAV